MKQSAMIEYFNTLTSAQHNCLLHTIKHCDDVLDLFGFYHITENPYRDELEAELKQNGFAELVDLFQQAEAEVEASHSAFANFLAEASAAGEIPRTPEALQVMRAFAWDCLKLPCVYRYVESTQLFDPTLSKEYFLNVAVQALWDATNRLFDANVDEARLYAGYRAVFMRVLSIFQAVLARHGISLGSLNHNRIISIKSDIPNLEERLRVAFSDTGDVTKDILIIPHVSDTNAANKIFEALMADHAF